MSRVTVKPEILRWARERAELTLSGMYICTTSSPARGLYWPHRPEPPSKPSGSARSRRDRPLF
jgi:hypothetical protein